MTTSPRASLSTKAEQLMLRLGLSYDHLLGYRFAVNVLLASTIVWSTLRLISDSNPIWAIASMVAASDPQREEQAAVDDRVEAAVEPGDVVMSACTKTGQSTGEAPGRGPGEPAGRGTTGAWCLPRLRSRT